MQKKQCTILKLFIDCTDNYRFHYLLNDVLNLKNQLISDSIYQFQGQCSVFNYQDGQFYRCLYETSSEELTANCELGGVLG